MKFLVTYSAKFSRTFIYKCDVQDYDKNITILHIKKTYQSKTQQFYYIKCFGATCFDSFWVIF